MISELTKRAVKHFARVHIELTREDKFSFNEDMSIFARDESQSISQFAYADKGYLFVSRPDETFSIYEFKKVL